MISNISYTINEKKFYRRIDLLDYLIDNNESVNDAYFFCKSLPPIINEEITKDPNRCTKKWLENLRNKNKPLVLLFSGGVDSAFALKNMIYHDCLPDYVLIYTLDPFDDSGCMSPYNMESKLAIDYFEYLKKNNKKLNSTKLWHIHLGSGYVNNFFDNNMWPKELSNYHYSLDTMAPWTDLVEISNPEDFIFIKGGDFPKFMHSPENSHCYLVDLQLSDIDSKKRRCHDFILDNNELLSCFATKIANLQKLHSLNKIKYNKEMGEKYLLPEFHNITPELPPQLDKRFNSLVPNFSDKPKNDNSSIVKTLNKKNLKSWLLYLQSEEQNPSWYQKYKESIDFYKNWITKTNNIPGIITPLIPIHTKKNT